jgi:hypothetical protein
MRLEGLGKLKNSILSSNNSSKYLIQYQDFFLCKHNNYVINAYIEFQVHLYLILCHEGA